MKGEKLKEVNEEENEKLYLERFIVLYCIVLYCIVLLELKYLRNLRGCEGCLCPLKN